MAGSISVFAPSDAQAMARRRPELSPKALRTALVAATILFGALGYGLTQGDTASHAAIDAGAELTRLLRLMTLLKCAMAIGAVGLLWLRFRFPITPRSAFGYVGGAAVMAAGPGVMWNMAHIGLGAMLLHGGFAALFTLAWLDGGTKWRLGR